MKTEIISFTVMEHWLSMIINGDYSGSDDTDAAFVRVLEYRAAENAPEGYHFGHFSTTDDRDEFDLCEICLLRGNVTRLEAVYFKNL